MQIFEQLLSPAFLLSATALLGLALGKLRIRGISPDMAGVLLVAAGFGVLLSAGLQGEWAKLLAPEAEWRQFLQVLSSVGTHLFLAVVGLRAGRRFRTMKSSKQWFAFLTGAAMAGAGLAGTLVMRRLGVLPSEGLLWGSLAGAMTSTPALSAARECAALPVADLVTGYSLCYLQALAGFLLLIQLAVPSAGKVAKASPACAQPAASGSLPGYAALVWAAAFLGHGLGTLRLPGLLSALGSSCGVLLCGGVIGWLGARLPRPSPQVEAGALRGGLLLFLLGTGVTGGLSLSSAPHPLCLVCGLLLTSASVGAGWLLARFLFRFSRGEEWCVICGGMTSTPAIGVLSARIPVDESLYLCAYTGALLTLVFGVGLLCRI